jgi:hypothetical protein
MAGGGIIFLIADVDVSGRRLQVFDPHGAPASETGLEDVEHIGKGGFGWIGIDKILLGSADPSIAAYVDPDELLMMMNWVVIVFDRLAGK